MKLGAISPGRSFKPAGEIAGPMETVKAFFVRSLRKTTDRRNPARRF